MRDDLEGLRQEEPEVAWYIARDGQQFGPMSDAELKKFIELGHMRGTDLVWRNGFADWMRAGDVFEIKGRGATIS